MQAYTFLSSRDPVGGDQLPHQLAITLATEGHDVAVFLVENGTFLARRGVCGGLLASLTEVGVRVYGDELALRERGIEGDALAPGVESAPLSVVVDHLAAGRKVSWH